MRLSRLVVSMAWAAGLLLSALVSAGPAAATQNRPSWSAGDFWQYATLRPDVGFTTRVTVQEATSVGLYPAFRVTVVTWQNRTETVQGNYTLWIRVEDLGIVKEEWEAAPGDVRTLTFDPPMAMAVFPLEFDTRRGSGNSWVRTMTVTETPNPSPSNSSSYDLTYDGAVVTERAVTVPAGTFPTSWIRTTPVFDPEQRSFATAISYYSENVGFYVKAELEDNQDGSTLSSRVMTAYGYAAPGRTALIAAGVVGGVVAAMAVAGVVLWRRSRKQRPPAKGDD